MGIIDNAKAIKDALAEVANLELKQDLLRIVNDALELQGTNRQLAEENRELAEKLRFREQVTFRDNAYWCEGDPDPYCSGCFDSKGQGVRLMRRSDVGHYSCPACKQTILVSLRQV